MNASSKNKLNGIGFIKLLLILSFLVIIYSGFCAFIEVRNRHIIRVKISKLVSLRNRIQEVYGKDPEWNQISSMDMEGLIASLGLDRHYYLEEKPSLADVGVRTRDTRTHEGVFFWKSSQRTPWCHFFRKPHFDEIVMNEDGNILWRTIYHDSYDKQASHGSEQK